MGKHVKNHGKRTFSEKETQDTGETGRVPARAGLGRCGLCRDFGATDFEATTQFGCLCGSVEWGGTGGVWFWWGFWDGLGDFVFFEIWVLFGKRLFECAWCFCLIYQLFVWGDFWRAICLDLVWVFGSVWRLLRASRKDNPIILLAGADYL